MNISLPVPSTVTSLSFSFLTAEDVRRISVKQITNPILLDDLNRPNIGGLYDPALGPSDRKDICATCHLTYYTCPGHFGHIELPITVFHPLFMTNMYNVLRATCLFCHKFKLGRAALIKFVAKLRLLEHGQLDAMHTLDDVNLGLDSKKDLKTMDQDTNDTSADSLLDYERRINLFITAALAGAGNSKRDHYKDPLVYQSRKDLISSFLKTSYLKKCQRCSAHSYTFRKEGHTKIIEYDLSAKQKKEHIAMNLSRPNVFSRQNQYLNPSKKNHRESTVISEEDESSEDEDLVDSISEVNEGYDSGEVQVEAHLPKAANGKTKSSRGRNERVITPDECRTHLRLLFMNEKTACSLLFGRHGPLTPLLHDGFPTTLADMFFIEVIAVTPTRFRPPAKMADTLFEHPHNLLLAKILSTAYRIRDVNDELNIMMAKGSTSDKEIQQRIYFSLLEGLIQLQVDVNSFIDSSKNPTPMRQGRVPPPGVKQGLEKKEGLFRMNMMGKRVNFAARSVISPDVNIEPSEIGIPPIFARKLTFPDPVTNHNVHDMRQLIINGPYEYPGASMVQYEDGSLQLLDKLNIDERKALANQLLTPQRSDCYTASSPSLSTRAMAANKKVYRHLQDGDMLILNRQPTLHKPSMMAHKARVLQGEKTIRMHYANCNSYNADFDGDEMNIHFPQNYVAIAEAQLIANTDNQYLVPTSGKPLRGLIQDHVVAGVWMTSKEAFFTREEYHQLLYGSLRPEEDSYLNRVLQTLPPAIWKPRPLWTGKQIISTILLNITPYNAEGLNLISKAKISGDLWGKNSEEGTVIFSEGEMLCGVLDKSQFGATDYGVVHSVYDLYGSEVAGKFLGILSRLFTKFLQHRAFTCRMDDLALTNEGENRRKDIFVTAHNIGADAAMDNFPSLASLPKSEKRRALEDLMNDVLRDDEKMAGLDVTVKKQLAVLTKSITDACMPNGLMRRFPFNHMQMMTQSGAKGSAVNAQQITCALGQQELEGRRVPVMVSGKTLPSFKAFETAAIAGGYVASRFLTGVKPQEFYFHCMAGREGLIDTAVKTSRSGYLQRCLIKHMEGIRVHYDYTVRGSDSSVYQFCYGGDALDVTRSRHLHQFDFNAMNYISLVNLYQSRHIAEIVNDEDAMRHNKKLIKLLDRQTNPDSKISQVDLAPALSLYNPSRYLGATSDIFAKKLHDYIRSNPEKYLKTKENVPVPYSSHLPKKVTSNQFRLLMNVRYMRSLAEPGEAVGLLAAQGVGEPSTQMTLNTFHFAGHGAANVTLGIPRLREIVMTASTKPKTPIMNMKLCDGVPIEKAQYFCKKASLLTLSQVTDYITVKESLSASRKREYSVDITFYPAEEYTKEYDVKSAELLAVFGTKFPLTLRKEIQSEMKKLAIDFRTHMKEMGKGRGTESRGKDDQEEHVDDDEERNLHEKEVGSEIGDGDADDIKRSKQRKEEISYDSDDQEVDDLEEYADEDIEANYEEDSNPDDEDQPIDSLKDQSKLLSSQMERITALFLQNFSWATSFFFSDTGVSFRIELDSDLPKLLLIGLVEQSSIKTIVREIPGIKECFTTKDNAKDQRVQIITNGSNLRGIWDFNHTFKDTIDVDSIYTNDIFAILHTYGVEMARAAIFKEISAVFGAYNIDVNERHLELIADYMTFNGDYKAFNRTGIATNPSPLLKASYETTGAFLSDATLYGDYDDLSSPSSTIVLGKPNLTGTGVFDIVQSLPQ